MILTDPRPFRTIPQTPRRELLATPGLPVVDEQTAQSLKSADALLAFLEAAVPDSAFLPGPGMVLTDLTTLTEGA